MKIDGIHLTHVRVPLVEPFRISNGVVSEKDGIIVEILADGLVGVGEASPMSGSFYSDDTPESTWDYLVGTIIPRIRKQSPESIDEINKLLDSVGGNFYPRAGIETAFWDIQAQCDGVPLHQLLGSANAEVESGLAVGIYPGIKELLTAIERHLVEGYKRLKIKIQPGWDIEPLREIRKRFAEIPLMVDANSAYDRTHFDHLKKLDEFGLMMIEQPLSKDDLEGHAQLQTMIQTPVCLDEGAKDIPTMRQAIHKKSCKIVNIKIQRVGGLKNAVAMHDLCAEAGIPVWAGTMPELGIGSVQTLHLASMNNFGFPTDVESSGRWFVEDIIEPELKVEVGMLRIPKGTGNCYHLKREMMAKYKVREEEF